MYEMLHLVNYGGCPLSGNIWILRRVLVNLEEIAWNLEHDGVSLPVHCALLTVSALLHPLEVHLGSSCLPLHCDGCQGAK